MHAIPANFSQTANFDRLVEIARQDPDHAIFDITRQYLDQQAAEVLSVLFTRPFAAALAFHHNISRYIFSISRAGPIWKELCHTHPADGSAHNASHVHSVILLMLLAGIQRTTDCLLNAVDSAHFSGKKSAVAERSRSKRVPLIPWCIALCGAAGYSACAQAQAELHAHWKL